VRDVFFLTCGALAAPEFAFGPSLRVSPFRAIRLTVTVGVVVRDDGSLVLVDAAWSQDTCRSPARSLGAARAAFLGVRTRPGDAIVAQLQALGFDPERVTTIIATHLHLDHIGGAIDFPNAEVVCTDRELEAYRTSGHPGYRAADLARAGRVRALTLDSNPSYGFAASHDLFGDGEILLLDARGHTRGSLAVALHGPTATYVHLGDAAYLKWEYGLSPAGPGLLARLQSWNRAEQARTYARLRACEADPRRPTLVPSHDRTVFASLPTTPSASAAAFA
jgi:glyoxylase-like metal-dependent hydrolase (beta-lactamase superfamily II)